MAVQPTISSSSTSLVNRIGAYNIVFCILLWIGAVVSFDDEDLINNEPHPDPNEEDYPNMIYIGRIDDDGKRVGFEYDNGMCLYI